MDTNGHTILSEDYVSFEVAKLLKEKGFDELCIFKYSSEGVRMKAGAAIDEWQNSELDEDEYSCPSQSMAMKWLREVHQLHIRIKPTWALGDMREPCRWEYDIINLATTADPMYYVGKSTYEEAVEAGIKYCLENLI